MPNMSEVKSIVKNASSNVNKRTQDSWAWGAAVFSEASIKISDTAYWKSINEFSSELSKKMDGDYLEVLKGNLDRIDVDTGLKFSAENHRILDGGHTFFESISRAKELGAHNDWSGIDTFKHWVDAYRTDMSSSAGMPMFGDISDEIYAFMRNRMQLSEEAARDFVTLNGQEAIQSIFVGSVSALGLYFAWKKEDQDAFSKIAGSILLTGTITLNPVLLAVAVAALAIGYQNLVCPKAVSRGAFITGSTFLVSVIIPGPLIIGLIPAIVLGYYLNKKMGKDFDLVLFFKENYTYIRSNEFKAKMQAAINDSKNKYDNIIKPTGT